MAQDEGRLFSVNWTKLRSDFVIELRQRWPKDEMQSVQVLVNSLLTRDPPFFAELPQKIGSTEVATPSKINRQEQKNSDLQVTHGLANSELIAANIKLTGSSGELIVGIRYCV